MGNSRYKFRAWNKHDEIMEHINDLYWFEENGVHDFNDNNYEFMQYTGLFDDDGNEIFEGDIVNIHDPFETKTAYKSEVLFTADGVRVWTHPIHRALDVVSPTRLLSHYCDYGHGGKPGKFCKIVGNIYENPDLIERGQT